MGRIILAGNPQDIGSLGLVLVCHRKLGRDAKTNGYSDTQRAQDSHNNSAPYSIPKT